ncbi:respiratory nitrate reductase subunit gamma [Nonomuraea sp. NPDC049480]|uniref:respiratory nitrate reductase subunit gamma n=1 Tax=Nonomuraea sp. NPDC049480 TaxID=3364353 RepID=UPI0037969B10
MAITTGLLFELHALGTLLLFAIWPLTRRVHVLIAPIGYLVRPSIVYRSRDQTPAPRPARLGAMTLTRG